MEAAASKCRRVLAAGAAVLAVACGQGTDDGVVVERTDSAGIEIVSSGATDRALDWTIEEVLRIDPESSAGAGVFQPHFSGVATDGAGRIHVLDTDGRRVVVFGPDGRFVHSLGGKGGGPGEVEFPLAMVVADDGSVGIYDATKRRLVRFGADGSIQPEQPLGDHNFFGGTIRQTDAGLLYDSRRGLGEGVSMSGVARFSGDSSSMVMERTNPPARPIELESCGMGFSGMPPLFSPTVRWDASGAVVAVATEAAYDIRVLENGREVRRVRRAVEPRAATVELAAQDLGDGMRVRTEGGVRVCDTGEVAEKRGFDPVIPTIGRIVLAPDGGMWVRRGGVRDEALPIDVFAPDGAYVGTLPPETPFPSAFLPDGRYVAVVTDELDVASLVVMQLPTLTRER